MKLSFFDRISSPLKHMFRVEDVTVHLERWCRRLPTFWEFRVHAFFTVLTLIAYFTIYDGLFSSVVALAATIQLSGQVVLLIQIAGRQTVHGISMKGVELTYLPVDYSGTWFYQVLEGCSFLVMVFLMAQGCWTRYRAVADWSFGRFFKIVAPLSLVLGFFTHPRCYHYALPNVCWMASVYLEMASVIPQLRSHMIDFVPVSGHWIFCAMLARGMNLVFWNDASKHFHPVPFHGDTSVYCLLASQCLHFCLLFCLFMMHVVDRLMDYKFPWYVLV